MSHEPVDTRVTAYVFGELSPREAARMAREIEQSPQLEEEVAAIRETIGALESEFRAQAPAVSDSHREAIELAIEQHSVSPATDSSHRTAPDSTPHTVPTRASHRRIYALTALAASALIIVGLAYPHVLGRFAAVTIPDGAPTQPNQIADALTNTELASLVANFNQLIEQQRYDDADVVARRVNEMTPDSPIGVALVNASRMGRQLANDQIGPAEMRLDPLSGTTLPTLPDLTLPDLPEFSVPGELSTSATASKQPATDGGEASPQNINPTLVPAGDLAQATGDFTKRAVADHETKLEGESTGGAGTQNSRRQSTTDKGLQLPKPAAGESNDGGPPLLAEADTDGERIVEFDMQSIDDIGLLGQPRRAGGNAPPGTKKVQEVGMDRMMENMGMGMAMDGVDLAMGGGGIAARAQRDRFEPIEDNAFMNVRQSPLSSFPIDVDTVSYAKVRALLKQNTLPPPAAVRIEEMLNYFHYDYPTSQGDHPFSASMEIATCPWNQKHRLARIGIKGKGIEIERPHSNLVFLIDVSGSMDEPAKLPLVVDGIRMLAHQFTENDKVAIVVYAGAAGVVLDSTRGDKKRQIIGSLDQLRAGGNTNRGQGILLAYQIARDNFIDGGTNRVILCTDGDFKVGVSDTDQLAKLAQQNAKSNLFLSILGFGFGNHDDAMIEQISNQGNVKYALIDNKSAAKKVLVEELGSNLITIAKDVQMQVEFNPKQVASYRLIGYENRISAAEDFDDDNQDVVEIGAGHTVTALYEIVPAEEDDSSLSLVDRLRYQNPVQLSQRADSGETLVLKLRYKQPEGDTSTLIEIPVTDSGKRFSRADRDFKFAASVAAFGMLLRDSPHKGGATFAGVHRIAREGAKGDDDGFRNEFVDLVALARQLRGE